MGKELETVSLDAQTHIDLVTYLSNVSSPHSTIYQTLFQGVWRTPRLSIFVRNSLDAADLLVKALRMVANTLLSGLGYILLTSFPFSCIEKSGSPALPSTMAPESLRWPNAGVERERNVNEWPISREWKRGRRGR